MKGSLRARLFAGALVWMIAVFVTVTALLLKSPLGGTRARLQLPRL